MESLNPMKYLITMVLESGLIMLAVVILFLYSEIISIIMDLRMREYFLK